MGHYGLDYYYLFIEVHVGDEAVLIATDVEDQHPGSRRIIHAWKRPLHFHERAPRGNPNHGEKPSERFAGGSVPFGELRDCRLAVDRHTSDVPVYGNSCQGVDGHVRYIKLGIGGT